MMNLEIMSYKSDDTLLNGVNPIPPADEDLLCQLLNQLELNLNERKPFVNQLLGIISLNDQAERAMASSSNSYGDDISVVEGLESPPACVVEDSEIHNSCLLPDENDGIIVFNNIKTIETGVSGDRKVSATEKIILSGVCPGTAIYNTFQATMDGDSGDLVTQDSSTDLSFGLEYMVYWSLRNFLACWIFFYRYSSFILLYETSLLSHMNAVMIYIIIILRQIQLDYYFFKLGENDKHADLYVITSLGLRYSKDPYRADLVNSLVDKDYDCQKRDFKDGFVLKDSYRTCIKTDAFKQIKLDAYLFSREWNCFIVSDFGKHVTSWMNLSEENCVLWTYYSGECLSTGIIMFDTFVWLVTPLKVTFVLHPCGFTKIIEQYEEDCRSFNQHRKDNFVATRLYIVFCKPLLSIVVASRQIELDLYLFSRVWSGLPLQTPLEYDLSKMLFSEEDAIWLAYHIRGLLSVCSSNRDRMFKSVVCPYGSLFVSRQYGFSSRQGFEDFFTMFFFPNQYTSWNSWSVMWDLGFHPCWAYLDVRPLSQFTPSARAWAVSTYIWHSWDLSFFDIHKLNDVLLVGGNWYCFTFVSHLLSYGRKDASLYVTRGSFMRIKRQHIHVMKEVPVAVHCNHGRSGADEDLVDTFVSFSVLDRVRISTSLLGSIYSCLDTYLYFLFSTCTFYYVAMLCNGSASSSVPTGCDG